MKERRDSDKYTIEGSACSRAVRSEATLKWFLIHSCPCAVQSQQVDRACPAFKDS